MVVSIGKWCRLCAALVFACIYSSTLQAQQSVKVSVENISSQMRESNIGITLERKEIGFVSSMATDNQGKVFFRLSTPGTYAIYATASDLIKSVDTVYVNVRANEHASASLLVVPKINELPMVVLEGTRYSTTNMNTQNAEVSSELTAKELAQMPIEGRDVTRSLYRLPNISQATGFYPEAPNVSINGANSLFTNYMIDGFDNNENFLGGMRFNIPIGFTENINVLTNNYSSEFGLTANGVINITSKMGSNDLRGEVFYLTRPGAIIDASSPYAQRDLSGNQVKDGFQRHQSGFGMGGALIRDKTFYYINFEHTTDIKDNLLNVPQLGVNETVRGQNEFNYLSGKLDQFWNKKWHSSLRFNMGQVGIDRNGGGIFGGVSFPSTANTQLQNSRVIASKNEYFGQGFTSETNYQYATFNWNYAEPQNTESPNVTLLLPDGETAVANLGHPGYSFNEFETTHQVQQKLTFFKGIHTIKTGVEAKISSFELFGGGNENGSYTVVLNQGQVNDLAHKLLGSSLSINDVPSDAFVRNYSIELRPSSFGTTQSIYSAYLEDRLELGARLNLNIGIRYDYDNLSVGGSDQGDLNNIAPRTSFNYQINEKSALRGGYGMFYEKITYAVYSDALQQSTTNDDFRAQVEELKRKGILPESTDFEKVSFEGNLTGSFGNAEYLNGPSKEELQGQRNSIFSNERRILNPNGYQNPYSHQFTLGYQRQVNKNTLFYIDLVHNRSFDLLRIRNLNAPSAYEVDPENGVARSTMDADKTRPVQVYYDESGAPFIQLQGDTLRGAARSIVMTESGGESQYYAASFTFNKARGADKYSFRMSYTLSLLENNTEDINFRAMDANNFDNEWGPSINDRTHLINTFFTYYPLKGLTVSLASLLQSGQPINRIPDAAIYGVTDLNGDGQSFADAYTGNSDRSPGEARNSDRLPWSNTFDASVQYRFKILKKDFIEVRADVFNLFNAVNLSGYSNNAQQSNQIQAGPASSGLLVRKNAAPPRQFQFGVRYLF